MTDFVSASLSQAAQTLEKFAKNEAHIKGIHQAIDLMVKSFQNKGRVFSCGNGGSLCDAQHFAEELTGRYRKDRPALAASSMSEPGHMSCVANDYGYEFIFSRYLDGWGQSGDVLLAISTSGNSPNIIKAVESARAKNMKVVGLLGKSGGKLKNLVDVPIIVESEITDRIQEVHIKIIHIMIEGIERALFPENYR